MEDANIRSISAKIQHGTYKFSSARGVAVEKPNKPGSVRPIVIPRASDRVVQRCILDALISDLAIQATAFHPRSFGGIPKREGEKLAGVPAAISAVLEALSRGLTHVVVADISSFFSCIRKSDAINLIEKHSSDSKFNTLFRDAIKVDLENHEKLWKYKNLFPYGDVGVGQGMCLSPFLGNLVLSEFDQVMNDGDCVCIRYVDDIIIIAPSGKAASARYRKAKTLLGRLGMNFSDEKSSTKPIEATQPFEYLGIEFSNGLLRPSSKSRISISRRAAEVAAKSLQSMRSAKQIKDFSDEYSIPKTLNKISGMSRGWANHYRFCNDLETIKNVDRALSRIYTKYAKDAVDLANLRMASSNVELATAFLGYKGLSGIEFSPLKWSIDRSANV
ncbi:reverse transcriptase domain-containing protein [Erythrobacter sp. sf7]|uniref:Reverse transcriptase domain-containing protein n=1 Tax=Erythrobacter fulvus TaxID=2987523 RepID=A0ABT5JT49_9SPHN|nr:reverse transcriptase domain-containing protein [Erythrobacter fulvus]MDC8754737.1 reverse transcriptase domain-containing protein [Erythrobacter fulvus]